MRRKTKTTAKRRTKTTTRRAKTAASRKRTTTAVKAIDPSNTTIKGLTERFNALVPAAQAAGLKWAKRHTSMFESKALGLRIVAKLEAELTAARR